MACKKCHPDRLPTNLKEKAERVFVELQKAYEANDLKKVTELLAQIESGIFDENPNDSKEKEQLLKIVETLSIALENLIAEVAQIRQSELFQTIQDITDIDQHLAELKARFTQELDTL